MEVIVAGLVKGRHEPPVDTYVFEEIEDPFDFTDMYFTAKRFVKDSCNVKEALGRCINSAKYAGDRVYRGEPGLVLYVTGLSSALAAVIRACAENGVSLTLMHFDRESGEYRPQLIF